jgi:hypothetical protein
MEKSVVLGLASGTKQVSASMARLVCYYAELLASQGLLTTALEYLNLSSSDDAPEELKALRDRITQSIQAENKWEAPVKEFQLEPQSNPPTENFQFSYPTPQPASYYPVSTKLGTSCMMNATCDFMLVILLLICCNVFLLGSVCFYLLHELCSQVLTREACHLS